MIEKGYLKKLSSLGFSIIPVDETKRPIGSWKEFQTRCRTTDEVENLDSPLYGLVTGVNDVECIDVDCKAIQDVEQRKIWFTEYLTFLSDNIDDFYDKFVIAKTKNNGFHILYKCKKIQGNTKIAKLKDSKEAVLESRGIGGMVVLYENFISKNNYYDIDYISEEDREILWSVSSCYNYIDIPVEMPHILKKDKTYDTELPVWNDYNDKTSILDLLSDFKIVRNLANKYIIKREGATSAYSGYVYKDSGCMFLFSTGTIYPHEKLLSPFSIYTYKFHNGDFSASAKDLYQKGFGSRVVPKVKELSEKPILKTDNLTFPIEVFPEEIQNYILLCKDTLDNSVDYMGCSMLWLTSVIIGNSVQVQVKTGWVETCTMWISVVGKAGLGKTPSISSIIFPLMKANNREIKKFIKQDAKYQEFSQLDKKEKRNTEEIKKPKKSQFIANDITLEALVDLHEESKNAVGVFKDELAGWFKDMNKYRAGSDLEFWLSTWSGKSVSMNRKTAKSSFVESPLIPVLGGIQPGILDSFYTEENKDNGFIDRMLLCFPDLSVDYYNDNELELNVISWYSDYIINFYDTIKSSIIQFDNESEIHPIIASFSASAKIEWKRIFNSITSDQNSDDENEYMKSMLPKQKSYIPRFALILNTLSAYHHKHTRTHYDTISKESVLNAEKLSNYFIEMAKKIKINTVEIHDIKKVVKANEGLSTKEKFMELYKIDPLLNKKEVAEILGVSRKTIYTYINSKV